MIKAEVCSMNSIKKLVCQVIFQIDCRPRYLGHLERLHYCTDPFCRDVAPTFPIGLGLGADMTGP